MTCQSVIQLLEDFLDKEVDKSQAKEIGIHLENCPDCKNNFVELNNLKELLSNIPIHEPSPDYWDESREIILARTVRTKDNSDSGISENSQKVISFRRSVISVAASLVIFLISIFIGSSEQSVIRLKDDHRFIATLKIEETLDKGITNSMELKDRQQQFKGMLLTSSIGMPGRFSLLFNEDLK